MQKIVSKYGLAAHLALLTVAPLVLLPFFGSEGTATVLLWLSLFGIAWLLMEPSRRRGEMSNDARHRVSKAVVRDPLFWFSIVLTVYAGVRMLNGGIGLAYDAEGMTWRISEPSMPFLPGTVNGAGDLLFVTIIALSVVFQGLRHGLGRSARVAYVLVASVVSAVAAVVMAFAFMSGHVGVVALMRYATLTASYYGTGFGLMLLLSAVASTDVIENEWVKAEPVAAIGMIGNAVGFVLFAPLHTVAAFAVAYLALVVATLCIMRNRCAKVASLRYFLAVMLSLAAPVLFLMSMTGSPLLAAKLAAVKAYEVFPEGFFQLRDVISAIALKTWKENPWLGTGLDSFQFDLRFMATAADWETVSSLQKTALSGWWQLITERGVIGCAVLAVAVGMLLWTYFARLIGSFAAVRFSAGHIVGPLCLLVLVALSFVDCSFLRPEVLMLAGACLAYSGGAFPAKRVSLRGEKEV